MDADVKEEALDGDKGVGEAVVGRVEEEALGVGRVEEAALRDAASRRH